MFETIGFVVAAALVLILVGVVTRYTTLWFRGWVTNVGISLPSLVFMSLRRVNPAMIVDAQVISVQAGLVRIPNDQLEAHFLAGGNVLSLVHALVVAHRARIELDWQTAAAIDLAGRDVLEAVLVSVNPMVIDCPDPASKSKFLTAVARDGIQLRVRVRVTVRTNLAQLIGGATERTIVARIGEGVVSSIGTCDSYQEALRNPLLISRRVLAAGLDSQTAFQLVSVDIADITVGSNIGARLRIDRAEAEIRIAVSRAEQRRAMAIAQQQTMKALTRENEALVVLAEAEIPKAVSQAFREGNMSRRSKGMLLAKDSKSYFPRKLTLPSAILDRGPI
jgi:uncharacterized protein YqfA (UPF0365 family)